MDEAKIATLMNKLGISREEAVEVINYDKAVDKGEKTPHDLTAEQEKTAAKMRRADRKPFVPKLEKRERKPNATKAGIVEYLTQFLRETADFEVENIEIVNKERQIRFESAGETFELTLVQKRKPKK